ncbi:hypothetical protein OF83DRAFT_825151 [Amylostereum chailletii]|nr:hypothetical protein OF83DRAFT_825151 [Amylostereum chailletii]
MQHEAQHNPTPTTPERKNARTRSSILASTAGLQLEASSSYMISPMPVIHPVPRPPLQPSPAHPASRFPSPDPRYTSLGVGLLTRRCARRFIASPRGLPASTPVDPAPTLATRFSYPVQPLGPPAPSPQTLNRASIFLPRICIQKFEHLPLQSWRSSPRQAEATLLPRHAVKALAGKLG